MISIRGGEVLTVDGWIRADVLVDGENVATIGGDLRGDVEIDASGCWVGPGFVDMHTHLREPGQTWKEDTASACAAAAAGGFTALTAMPNTDPPMDSVKIIDAVRDRAERIGIAEVVPAGAMTKGRGGAHLADLEEMYRAGVRLFSDDGDALADPDLVSAAMGLIAKLPGAIFAQHAEDARKTAGGHMHAGAMARKLGIGGLPADAETDVVRRDLEVAARSGVRYHCQHVSAKSTVEVIREARESGMAVSAEVTPHHLIFDESALANLDPNFKMYPPLRSPEDREALVAGLHDGVIEVVATDHAPHRPDEKAVGFEDAPRGVIGLETAAPATWEAVGDRSLLFSVLSSNPARILGLESQGSLAEGAPANLVVFDPVRSWVPTRFASKSSNSPFKDRVLRGQVRSTLYRGTITHLDGESAR
ncbi:MAG TPA: dihydroorotase [Acidimicrobiia bacterium]|nr:dihydroorotase [Acidimicrobiia bacterium]